MELEAGMEAGGEGREQREALRKERRRGLICGVWEERGQL
jgi:hypothetical protein